MNNSCLKQALPKCQAGRVILYNPKEKTSFKVPYIPFSLLTVASALRQAGFAVRIIDARIEKDSQRILQQELSSPVLFLGMTLMTGSVIEDALMVAALAKEKQPGLKVIVGGVHASLLPQETAAHALIDAVVVGAGEMTAVTLARRLKNNEPWNDLSGIAFSSKAGVQINSEAPLFGSREIPEIDYSLLELGRYVKKDATGTRCLDYLSSRGCPHSCTYCAISKLWKEKIYYYSAEKMVDEVQEWVERYSLDSIRFLDDNFFVDRKRVDHFCDGIMAQNLRVSFWAMCRIQYFAGFDDAFLKKLKQAGFVTFNFGAESGSQKILDRIKKGIHVEQILQTAERCHKFGFRAQFSFMMAFPFEEENDLQMTMDLIERIHSINSSFDCQLFPYTPFPQTELAQESLEYGFRPPECLEDWARFEYGCIKMPWLSKAMRERIDTLTTLAWFAFTSETAIKLGGLKGRIFLIMGALARWRWRHRFFSWPLEWKLINWIARR